MGVVLLGCASATERGTHYHMRYAAWIPLSRYAWGLAKVEHTDLNDREAERMARLLEREVRSMRTEAYISKRDAELDAVPNIPCNICGATGYRAEPPVCGPGILPCNGCDAKGSHRPNDDRLRFTEEDVRKFIVFLRESGGFFYS